MPRSRNLTNLPFGRLTAKKDAGRSTAHGRVWKCECQCGVVVEVPSGWLTSGNTQSCGCLKRDTTRARNTTHGLRDHKDYELWYGMIQRCYYPKHVQYDNYGGRGVKVCDRWLGRNGFKNFLSDMGARPSSKHSIDRFPNRDGDYTQENCRWSTNKEQCRNKRNNRVVTYLADTKTLIEWSEELGMNYDMLLWRLNAGWAVEKAFTTASRRERGTKS